MSKSQPPAEQPLAPLGTKDITPSAAGTDPAAATESWKEWRTMHPVDVAPNPYHSGPADPGETGATATNLDLAASPDEKMAGLWDLVDRVGVGMLVTRDAHGDKMPARAMGNLDIDREGRGALWFVRIVLLGGTDFLLIRMGTASGQATDRHSAKVQQITQDSHVTVTYLSTHKEWASIYGRAAIVDDREVVKEKYKSTLRMWLGDVGDGVRDGGPDDPRLVLIKIIPSSATYSAQSKSTAATFVEMAKAYVTGEPPKIHDLRNVEEMEMAGTAV
ncbi:hypothetical protein DFJ74DRAFT_758410 [Hyaloraphidium curvatum]|nr:hypothetical protein DFJ74DRAFT_758410 [Hyaloraphidium curvatum]